MDDPFVIKNAVETNHIEPKEDGRMVYKTPFFFPKNVSKKNFPSLIEEIEISHRLMIIQMP